MDKNQPDNEELFRFRAEAEALLGGGASQGATIVSDGQDQPEPRRENPSIEEP